MLDNLKDFVNGEVVSWFKAPVHPAPGKGSTFFAVRFELQQGVVDAVEEYFVVDVFALGQERLKYFLLTAGRGLLRCFLLFL